ncbi:MAG: hypothetical protein IMW93_06070 [Thermoanaerobacteraceae bacterium]|nr:hypothetical protein [Thermoanaerobacteraceae bacterium]
MVINPMPEGSCRAVIIGFASSLPPVVRDGVAYFPEQLRTVVRSSFFAPNAGIQNGVYLAAAVKPAVKVPVLVTGGLGDPVLANAVIAEGKADLVGIGRALLADPEWARKAKAALG